MKSVFTCVTIYRRTINKHGVFFIRTGFPGAQPVSMDKQNIKFLEQKPYKVSWKADGTR